MILIFSNASDVTTQLVTDWLKCYNRDYLLVTEVSPVISVEIKISQSGSDLIFATADREVNIKSVSTVWYRRGSLNFKSNYKATDLPPVFSSHFNYFIKNENLILNQFFFRELSNKCVINNADDDEINKLSILNVAAQVGLTIPETKICMNNEAPGLNGNQIIKPLSNAISFYYGNYMCQLLTQKYNNTDAAAFPTLLQAEVKKQFEIRSFYLDGSIYSIAMFTQGSQTTQTDYRNYDFNKPVRSVPFSLPESIGKKVQALMETINLRCGSIDFMFSTDNKFYFLEVNPLGQFGNVSYIGNYYLEKRIAEKLYGEH